MSLDVTLYRKIEYPLEVIQKMANLIAAVREVREEIKKQDIESEMLKKIEYQICLDNPLPTRDCLYDSNLTHNLNTMAEAAGIYQHLWRPEELGITKASELIEPLTNGLKELEANPTKYKELNPANGWGTYEGLLQFIQKYLNACKENPDAFVEASR